MKGQATVRNYYVLPCCLLLLNFCVEIVSYKAKSFGDPLLRTAAIIAMVLFGGSLVAFALEPAVTYAVAALHRSSRRQAGELGGLFFLLILGALVFWLYYRWYILGPESVLPRSWWNSRLPH